MSAPYMDISGLVSAQTTYLANLSPNTPNPDDAAKSLGALNTSLAGVSSALGNNSSAYILSGQQAVHDIVTREKNRLDAKAQSVAAAESNRARLITMNTNSKKRYAAYTNILIALAAALTISIGAAILRAMGYLPEYVFSLLMILIVLATLYYCGSNAFDIFFRDRVYFDEIDNNSPFMTTPERIARDISNNKVSGSRPTYMNNLSVGLVGCIGSQCCSGNTVWDAVNGVCTPAVSGFTTLAGASAADGVEKGGSKAAPYSAFEFGEYARL